MVYRFFVEKKPGFDDEAQALLKEINSVLEISSLKALRIFNRYDIEGIDEKLFEHCKTKVFSEPQLDDVYDSCPAEGGCVFAVEFLPGQFDQRADYAAQCIQLISKGI